MPVKPVTKEEMINSYKSVERRQSSSSRMFGGYDFEYINLYNAGELMDSWAALQTGERDERIKELEEKLRWFATYELEKDSLFVYKVMQKSATLLLNRPNGV